MNTASAGVGSFPDRRYLRAELAIETAMNELLVDEHFLDMKVRDICQKSKVSSATFYRHFHTLSEVLTRKSDKLMAEFLNHKSFKTDDNTIITATLLFFCKHKDFYGAVMRQLWFAPTKIIIENLRPWFFGRWSKYGNHAAERLFVVFGFEMIGVLYWWCMNDNFDVDLISTHANYLSWILQMLSERIEILLS